MRKKKETLPIPEISNDVYVGRDYSKLVNEYADFELPVEIKKAFKHGQGYMFGGCLNRAKIRMYHIEKKINPEDISYIIGLSPERMSGEDYPTYRNRRILARILYRDRSYLNMLSSARQLSTQEIEENGTI